MKTEILHDLRVQSTTHEYHILIGVHLLNRLPDLLPESLHSRNAAIICDDRVHTLYGMPLMATWNQWSAEVNGRGRLLHPFIFKSGESSKNIRTLYRCHRHLIQSKLSRDDFMIVLGGGVAGDLGGFAAATYMRGIRYIHVPTSLIALTDSSVGGKTAINLPEGKNLVGAFHAPTIVISDITTLKTLAPRHRANGIAEIIKMGVLSDAGLFERLESLRPNLLHIISTELADIVMAACSLKADIVSRDERESGIRAILNLGHTIGHALETRFGCRKLLHGESVGLGLLAACRISELMGLTGSELFMRIQQLFKRFRLPLKIPFCNESDLVEMMYRDKKVQNQRMRFILPIGIGNVVIRDDVPVEMILRVLRELQAV